MIWYIDLQLFADDEKTEQPTPKRRREAREKGQVFKSTEINMVAVLLASFLVIKAIFPSLLQILTAYERQIYTMAGSADGIYTSEGLSTLFMNTIIQIGKGLWLFMLSMCIIGITANIAQVGFVFSGKPLAIDLGRLNPVAGFKRIFSKRAINELVKSILKIAIIGYVAYTEIRNDINIFLAMSREGTSVMIYDMVSMVLNAAIKLTAVMAIVAVLDYIFQRQEYERNLRMSKQEVKQEFKETEGDPQIKARIRQIQRQLAMMRMMQQVPKADVVVTNPTHFAVALRYDAETDQAPVILAKGADYMAQRIKDVARQNRVPIVENRELARNLYYAVDIGQIIPPQFYEAVAEVLAYVYNMGRR